MFPLKSGLIAKIKNYEQLAKNSTNEKEIFIIEAITDDLKNLIELSNLKYTPAYLRIQLASFCGYLNEILM